MRKEAEKIVFPPFPDVLSRRSWKTSESHAVVQASARPDPEAVLEWIKQSFEKGKKMEDVNEAPRHLLSLDGKVAAAI